MKKIVSGLGIIGVGGWVDAIEPGGWTGGRSQGGAGEEGGTSASARPGQAGRDPMQRNLHGSLS